jgi:hypothetical protein
VPAGVLSDVAVLVTVASEIALGNRLAIPKSTSLTRPLEDTIAFAALRSECTIPWS